MNARGMHLPHTPVDRVRAGSAVQSEIAAHLDGESGFVDIRTLGSGHWVVEAVATTESAGHALARSLNAHWEVMADFRPGPLQDVIAWEGYVNVWPMDVPVRVVAVVDHPGAGEPFELTEVHHYESDDDRRWLERERAAGYVISPERAAEVEDVVHRWELAGAL